MICQLWDKSPALDLGIPHVDESIFFTWGGRVYFSVNARGDTLEMHVAAKGKNKLYLRQAADQVCQYLFMTYPWCKKVAANVNKRSVKNLCLKCGFVKLIELDDCEVMVRWA